MQDVFTMQRLQLATVDGATATAQPVPLLYSLDGAS
jgi:hypothetical protein